MGCSSVKDFSWGAPLQENFSLKWFSGSCVMVGSHARLRLVKICVKEQEILRIKSLYKRLWLKHNA